MTWAISARYCLLSNPTRWPSSSQHQQQRELSSLQFWEQQKDIQIPLQCYWQASDTELSFKVRPPDTLIIFSILTLDISLCLLILFIFFEQTILHRGPDHDTGRDGAERVRGDQVERDQLEHHEDQLKVREVQESLTSQV